MGVVYAARDRQLDRVVALKMLRAVTPGDDPASQQQRVLREARAMARLAHPNVVAVHDVGVLDGLVFVAMEFVEGDSLSTWLRASPRGWPEVLAVFLAAGRGLAAAHAAGIVHRDFKPDNVLIGKDGRVRVTDFGLARLAAAPPGAAPAAAGPDRPDPGRSIGTGALVGSLAYMAPEQMRGQAVDHRSDLYAFCVALWEALFAARPFAGETFEELDAAIRQGEPRRPKPRRGLPAPIVRALRKGLSADPDDRFDSMEALLSRLEHGRSAAGTSRRGLAVMVAVLLAALAGGVLAVRSWRPGGAPAAASSHALAVLPFRNLGGDEEGEYLADGVTDDLILSLGKVEGLRVTGRSSVFSFKGKPLEARAVGRQLGVGTVLEGSVHRSGQRLRVTARLVDVGSGSELWSEALDREAGDLFRIYQRVRREVVTALELDPPDWASGDLAGRAEDVEAHGLVLKGRYLAQVPLRLRDALAAFEQAIAVDPGDAAAWAGASVVHARLGSWTADGKSPPAAELGKAVAAARRALELDPTEGLAHAVLGYLDNHFDWDVAGAEREFREALHLRPNDVDVLHWYAHFLASQGRFDEELAATRRGIEIDPLHRYIESHLAFHYLFSRQYPRAIEEAEKALQLYPDEPFANLYAAMAYELAGQRARAVARLGRLETIRPGWLFARAQLGFTYARMGRAAEARAVLRELTSLSARQYVSPHYFAVILVGLGEREQALSWLEKALADRSWWMTYLMIDPRFDLLRDDPRFAAILAGVGFGAGAAPPSHATGR
jgi:TolB-like protein/Tfp pilus assembly protein PilF